MKLVIDNNVLFSLMKPSSVNSYVFSSLSVDFCAPDFLKDEFNKHKTECMSKSGLSSSEFNERFREIVPQITFIPRSQFEHLFTKVRISDSDDIPYIAAALSINASIWSNDADLKEQPLVKVFTTAELVEMLFKVEL